MKRVAIKDIILSFRQTKSASKTAKELNISRWTVDESKFNPPADIEFQDFSKMLAPSGSQGGTQDQQSQCSVCDNLTGDDKIQCRSALKCN